MPNIKLKIEYDGTNYGGWQRQKNSKSIQETIERVLMRILREKVHLVASGRTDSGVHAKEQVANFETKSNMPLDKLQKAMNSLLPEDISINSVRKAPLDFHSRFQAKSKVYRYTILNRASPSALLRNRVYFYPYPLDTQSMKKEAGNLLGKRNFRSFQASSKKKSSAVRTIKALKVVKNQDIISIDIEADGFLYNMVRNIVGTLIEIGRGKLKKGSLREILAAKDRSYAGPTAPAQGLCLMKVKYA
ncbi:MAG: tRNA pseudouridine(38-40) synthase TruA [Candidatus Omnitrophota bacterium]